MRKRVVIALLAIVVMGVVAFFVSQPREGTVEWHKRKFRDAQNASMNWSRYPRLDRIYRQLTGTSRPAQTLTYDQITNLNEQMNISRKALVQAGYLMERTFTLSNRSPNAIVNTIMRSKIGVIATTYPNFTQFTHGGRESNALAIVGLAADMAKWEDLIRKADVPEDGR